MQALTLEHPAVSSLAAERHTLGLSVLLHLLPGLLTGVVYYLLALPVTRLGLPSIVALMIAGVLVMMPFELGVIAWAARMSPGGPRKFIQMVGYRQSIPLWHYLALAPAVFVATGLLFTLMKPAQSFLQGLFGWLPSAMVLDMGQAGNFPRGMLVWVTALNLLLFVLIIPNIEELYFRGFLLPRLPEKLKGWTPLANSFLFAAYHFWSPWMIVTRTVGLLPMIYIVRREKNIYLGMIVHCLANAVDVVMMVVLIAGMK